MYCPGQIFRRVRRKALPAPPGNDRKDHTMRLTTKGRFAVTAMIDVAMHGG